MTKLSEYLKDNSISQRTFAGSVGVSPSYLSELVKGLKSPGLSLALKIQKQSKGKVSIESLSSPVSSAPLSEAS